MPPKPHFIGLGHYSRTGKDTFANAFIEAAHNYYPQLKVLRVSFASKLKAITHDLYGWAGLQDEAYYNTPEGEVHRDTPLVELGGLTPVDVWVKFGTDAVRNNVWDGTWVDHVLRSKSSADIIIIPDVRFVNEVAAIRRVSGQLYKIVRPGVQPRNTVADQALLGYVGWDATFSGDGDIDKLRTLARLKALQVCSQVWDRKSKK
jgi:hypothetical protein